MENLVSEAAFRQFFAGKKIFITGHTGFKGAWLSLLLRHLGAELKGYALPPEGEESLYAETWKGETVLADIRDRDRLKAEMRSFAPDLIFHLAAQPLVRRSYEIPAETFDVNVTGTANLLEGLAALPGACSAVVITTDKVYQNKEEEGILYREDDTLGGYDPYSASKACTELVASSFRDSFFNTTRFAAHRKALATVRAGNVIGGGDRSKDRIIPDIVRSLQQGTDIPVRNPDAVRPWQHVLEPLTGYLQMAMALERDPLRFSRPFNFGPRPEDHLPVKALVEQAIQSWGGGSWNDESDGNAPHEAGLLKLDSTRAQTELGWTPKLDAARAIDWTIRWYRQSAEQRADYTLEQIREYLAL
ncbi:MAG TPA: CDP-glucose 4,6-dehydratase [Chitinophagaceae bacterium]|jgi:CDP-glucose 4,6-dehydratase|nr:CDP-glucose 4,6-dehydratase [Chitinophagaceae bacterium]